MALNHLLSATGRRGAMHVNPRLPSVPDNKKNCGIARQPPRACSAHHPPNTRTHSRLIEVKANVVCLHLDYARGAFLAFRRKNMQERCHGRWRGHFQPPTPSKHEQRGLTQRYHRYVYGKHKTSVPSAGFYIRPCREVPPHTQQAVMGDHRRKKNRKGGRKPRQEGGDKRPVASPRRCCNDIASSLCCLGFACHLVYLRPSTLPLCCIASKKHARKKKREARRSF